MSLLDSFANQGIYSITKAWAGGLGGFSNPLAKLSDIYLFGELVMVKKNILWLITDIYLWLLINFKNNVCMNNEFNVLWFGSREKKREALCDVLLYYLVLGVLLGGVFVALWV